MIDLLKIHTRWKQEHPQEAVELEARMKSQPPLTREEIEEQEERRFAELCQNPPQEWLDYLEPR